MFFHGSSRINACHSIHFIAHAILIAYKDTW